MNIFPALISLLLSTSLYPAANPPRSYDGAHAAASAAAADVKRAAAETDSKTSHGEFDGEVDTKQLKTRRTPPADEELKQALERARKCDSRISILNELAVPYATKDPYVFALELYKQWRLLCKEKGLLADDFINLGDIVNEIRAISLEDRNRISSIAACCFGIIYPHVGMFDHEAKYNLQMEICNTPWYYMLARYQGATYEEIESADKLYRDAQVNAPLIVGAIQNVTPLLPELVGVVEGYMRRDCLTVAATSGRAAPGKFESCMLGDLEGLRDCTEREIDLRYNWITRILRNDLPQSGTLERLHCWGNPIAYIAPHAFAEQRALTVLNLGECQLTRIARPMFAGLLNLTDLTLSANPICDIEPGAISQLTALDALYLRHCALQAVPEDLQLLVGNGKLIELALEHNPLEQNPVENGKKERLLELVQANIPQEKEQ
jgi:hypothetical protein